MTFLKTIAASVLTGLVAFGASASASYATPTTGNVREGSSDAHLMLVQGLQRNGLQLVVNHESCNGLSGFYSSWRKLLVVCQDNGVAGGPMVEWTANDMDTLRHEAQHFIQDCVVGGNHDNQLSSVYRSPAELGLEVLGTDRIQRITESYRAQGADDPTLLLEYEAFAVARMNVPLDQVRDMKLYCGV